MVAYSGADDGFAEGHRFDQDKAERFIDAGENEDIAGGDDGGDVIAETKQPDSVAEAQVLNSAGQGLMFEPSLYDGAAGGWMFGSWPWHRSENRRLFPGPRVAATMSGTCGPMPSS